MGFKFRFPLYPPPKKKNKQKTPRKLNWNRGQFLKRLLRFSSVDCNEVMFWSAFYACGSFLASWKVKSVFSKVSDIWAAVWCNKDVLDLFCLVVFVMEDGKNKIKCGHNFFIEIGKLCCVLFFCDRKKLSKGKTKQFEGFGAVQGAYLGKKFLSGRESQLSDPP